MISQISSLDQNSTTSFRHFIGFRSSEKRPVVEEESDCGVAGEPEEKEAINPSDRIARELFSLFFP